MQQILCFENFTPARGSIIWLITFFPMIIARLQAIYEFAREQHNKSPAKSPLEPNQTRPRDMEWPLARSKPPIDAKRPLNRRIGDQTAARVSE